MQATQEKQSLGADKPTLTDFKVNWEMVIFLIIVAIAILSRFYDLGARVMSHDESLHTLFSWNLFRGNGYQHTPMMHGPLQFHLVAFSYFLFEASDFTARIPAALASIATIVFLWNYRRFLGRTGTLIAAGLFLISPYMLYYGRYVRNEAFVALIGVITLWAILRYLESGQNRYLYYLTAATALHFTVKETAFIYTAQALLFLGFYFLYRISRRRWVKPSYQNIFVTLLIIALFVAGIAGGMNIIKNWEVQIDSAEVAEPANPEETPSDGQSSEESSFPMVFLAIAIIVVLCIYASLYFLIFGYGWRNLRNERSFGLLVILGTLVLPQLSPFVIEIINQYLPAFGWDPLNYFSFLSMTKTAVVVILMLAPALLIGLLWKPRIWLINFGIFFAIFTVLYTTIFTNGPGFFSGMVGSLGYWIEQQAVERGSQPWYYYLLVQIPFYEYLPALGSLLAAGLGIKSWWKTYQANRAKSDETEEAEIYEIQEIEETVEDAEEPPPTTALIGFWAITSLLAFTIAGERMPWLTVHITLPMLLLSGWALGKVIDSIDWQAFREKRGHLVILALPVFIISLLAVFGLALSDTPPFQGKDLEHLNASSNFLTALVIAGLSGAGVFSLLRNWEGAQIRRTVTLAVFSLFGLLTVRTAAIASYVNYDNATEFLVYAHSARGVKDIMEQVEEISRRTTNGLDIVVAYDEDVPWPFSWYLRDYEKKKYYGETPTIEIREASIILVGNDYFNQIGPVVGENYYQIDYIRMWWPNQDYFDLTWERIANALFNPSLRTALWDIWFYRDYEKYALTKELEFETSAFSLANWSPADEMRMYIRKDIVAQLWDYGFSLELEPLFEDPYKDGKLDLIADNSIGTTGNEPGQFQGVRGFDVAPDGSLYIADTDNHRIQHMAPDGSVLNVWGAYGATTDTEEAPTGAFNQPWDVAVSPIDGSVYVADTWNHRIQKFTANGEFVTAWGFSQYGSADPYGFWGPRGIAVDLEGRVYVTDTGNHRVLVFDADGLHLDDFGGAGFGNGQFSEPVGIDVGLDGRVFVADTWNQRIQVFYPTDFGGYSYLFSWNVNAWFGDTLNNKPYIAVNPQGHVFITDPEMYRVIEFTAEGQFVRFWGDFSAGLDGFGLASGIAIDPLGNLWVSDGSFNRILHFTLP